MKKKIVAILTLLVMLTAVFVFVGCNKKNNPDAGSGANGGGGGGIPLPSDYAACELNPMGYDIDDVTFEVYFGSLFGAATGGDEAAVELTLREGAGFEYAEIYFVNHAKNEQEDWYLIRRIDDYTSVEYGCWHMPWGPYIKSKFNHHESVTIPKELLIGNSGSIDFLVYARPRYNWEPAPTMRIISGCVVDYTIINEKVTLISDEEVED